MNSVPKKKSPSHLLTLVIILVTACIPQFISDVYAPAIPAISEALSSSAKLVQTSLVVYLLGSALTLLIFGPLSEAFGRKRPLLVGFGIMAWGTILCLFATSAYHLILGRFIQGLGAGAAGGIWRAIFRDAFEGEELSKYGAYLSLAVIFVIPTAPVLGGALYKAFSWQMIFAFILASILATMLFLHVCFEDSSKRHHRDRLAPGFVLSQFKRVFLSRTFIAMTLCMLLSYGAYFSWFVTSPILLVHLLKLDPVHYGLLGFIGGAMTYGLAGLMNGRLVKHVGTAHMLRLGWGIMLTSGCVLLALRYAVGIELWVIFIPATCYTLGALLIMPNAFATAMEPFGDIAGYAGSAYSFMQMLGGAIVGLVTAQLPSSSQAPLALAFIACAGCAWLIYEMTLGAIAKR